MENTWWRKEISTNRWGWGWEGKSTDGGHGIDYETLSKEKDKGVEHSKIEGQP